MPNGENYSVPDVWSWDEEIGGIFGSINRPFAGATHEEDLPIGKHPLQLYSQGTPNGVKVTILLEELLAAGHNGAEYDAWLIKIGKGEQFSSGFVEINFQTQKIPALVDHSSSGSADEFLRAVPYFFILRPRFNCSFFHLLRLQSTRR